MGAQLKNLSRRVLLFLFSHRFLAIARWELHFLKTRSVNALKMQNYRVQRLFLAADRPRFLNLGAGPRGRMDKDWLNVDGFRGDNIHYTMDIARPLPIPADSLEGVFCEHVLEHFSMEDGERILREVHRILRPGGNVRIVVPDAELIVNRYGSNPRELVERRGNGKETAMEIVNVYFRQRYEHQFLYDWLTLKRALERAGFERIERASFGRTSMAPEIVLDAPNYEWESLYVDAAR